MHDLHGGRLRIGRGDEADVRISDHRVSRLHAEIERVGDAIQITDLDSSNGTLVNGVPIFRPTKLSPEDTITFGGEVTAWLETGAASPARAAPASSHASGGESHPKTVVGAGGRARQHKRNLAPVALGVGAVAALIIGLAVWPGDDDNGAPRTPAREAAVGATAGEPTNPSEEATADHEPSAPGQDAVVARGPETTTPTVAMPKVTEEDLLRDFELSLVDGRFAAAWECLDRISAARREPLRGRLDEEMERAAKTATEQATQLRTSKGAAAATSYLKERLAEFPPLSDVHTDLTATLLELTPRKRKPAVATATNPDREEPAESKPTAAPATKVTEDVFAAATAKVDEGDVALRGRDFNTAERRFQSATDLLKGVSGPSRLRNRALRGIRGARAQRSFVDCLIKQAGGSPGQLGRIPHLPGESSRIIRISHEGVTFASADQPIPFAWRVLPKRSFEAIVAKLRLAPENLLDAAAWLHDYGSDDEAEKLHAKAYKALPGLKPQIDQALADARHMRVPDGGFSLLDGRWYSPRELAREKLNQIIAAAEEAIKGDDIAERDDAIDVLMGLGEVARSKLHWALVERKVTLTKRLTEGKAAEALGEIGALRSRLEEARASALELIFDTERYPYPYRPPRASQEAFEQYRTHQPMVNQRVAAVKALWEDPRSVNVPGTMRETAAEILAIDAAILTTGHAEAPEGPPGWLMHLPAEGTPLTVRTIAVSQSDRDRIDQAVRVISANKDRPGVATRGEIAQCRITNEYRVMMGRWAVRLYDPLTKASHGHCADMGKVGFFAHMSPVPGKASPMDRVVLEGMAPSGVSENIAINSGPQGAHNAWVHSPGHHRNILGRAWRLMGPGNVGRHWCQNFSVRDNNQVDAYNQ